MPREFRLPDLGEGIHEGEVVEVLVAVGDRVLEGHPILIVETDKATAEIPSPFTGVIREIRVKPGETVRVGAVLMVFEEEGETPDARPPEISIPAGAPPTADLPRPRVSPALPIQPEAPLSGPVPAAPSTRRLARELGVDLRLVPPTGPGGRVTPEDVSRFAQKTGPDHVAPPRELPASSAPPTPIVPAAGLPDFSRWGPVRVEPLRSVRRATARHMTLAWSQIPHVTHQDVADVTELETFRQRHKAYQEARGGVLSLTVFAMKATVAALKAFPRFNASLDAAREEIIFKEYYHLGIAVDTDRGLLVPVIRDVDRKSIAELGIELAQVAARARIGKLEREELRGGTFTITNIGVLGGTGFTPIVNFPEVAILGLAQARLQPVVKTTESGPQVVPRLMLPLILGFDHRVLDGADAARFLGVVIDHLSNPERLFLTV